MLIHVSSLFSVMEKLDRPVDYARLTTNICGMEKVNNVKSELLENSLSSTELAHIVGMELESHSFTELLPQGQEFIDETRRYFNGLAEKLKTFEEIERKGREDYLKIHSLSEVSLFSFPSNIEHMLHVLQHLLTDGSHRRDYPLVYARDQTKTGGDECVRAAAVGGGDFELCLRGLFRDAQAAKVRIYSVG